MRTIERVLPRREKEQTALVTFRRFGEVIVFVWAQGYTSSDDARTVVWKGIVVFRRQGSALLLAGKTLVYGW